MCEVEREDQRFAVLAGSNDDRAPTGDGTNQSRYVAAVTGAVNDAGAQNRRVWNALATQSLGLKLGSTI